MSSSSHDPELEALKRASVGQSLFRAARLLNEVALARIRGATGIAVRPAHTALFPHIDLGGTRLTVLAARVGCTKQAVGELVDELVGLGVLEKAQDPADGRARLIRFAGGSEGLQEGLRHLAQLEGELQAEVGEASMGELRRGLAALLPALERRALDLS